jgi:hypothetical protein
LPKCGIVVWWRPLLLPCAGLPGTRLCAVRRLAQCAKHEALHGRPCRGAALRGHPTGVDANKLF